jgi:uncharacterized membrane protein YGL010W
LAHQAQIEVAQLTTAVAGWAEQGVGVSFYTSRKPNIMDVFGVAALRVGNRLPPVRYANDNFDKV